MKDTLATLSITIPKQHYLGAKVQHDNPAPLGFLTPFGTDKAFEKRKDTVDRWAGESYTWTNGKHKKAPPIPAQVLDNVLLEGFEISKEVRRHGWGSGNVVWRILDPRGFELEIPSSNFARIVDCTTIVNGVISGKCIWGRDKAQNLLLPEVSEPYQQAIENTDRLTKKVSIKDVKPGYHVTLKNGHKGIYLGVFNIIGTEYGREAADLSTGWRSQYMTVYNLTTIKRRFLFKTLDKHAGASDIMACSEASIATIDKVVDGLTVESFLPNVIKAIHQRGYPRGINLSWEFTPYAVIINSVKPTDIQLSYERVERVNHIIDGLNPLLFDQRTEEVLNFDHHYCGGSQSTKYKIWSMPTTRHSNDYSVVSSAATREISVTDLEQMCKRGEIVQTIATFTGGAKYQVYK